MFMDSVGHSYPSIYVPTKIKQNNELFNIVMQQTISP